jgi:uncharacterized protein involved in outer membrane biogenesis
MILASNRAGRYALLAAALIIAIALLLVLFPWNVLRGALASHVGARLHRDVAIDRLDVHPGWTTRVELNGVTIGNAAWSQTQPMATFPSVVMTFRLAGLLRASPETVRLIEPDVLLERNSEGEANWHFEGQSGSVAPRIGAIDVDRGRVRFIDPAYKANIEGTLQTASADSKQVLRFESRGTLRGEAFQLQGQSEGLGELRNFDAPYRLSLNGRAGATEGAFDGTVVPSELQNLHGALHLKGPDLSKLYPIIPVALPWTPPYDLAGDLSHDREQWIFRGIHGTVGSSDLAGDLTVDVSSPRALTTANFTSKQFDYKDLGGFVGLQPGRSNVASRGRATTNKADSANSDVLPGRPLQLAKLRAHDADVRFKGTSFKWGTIPLDNLATHLTLKDGVMRFDPLDFGLAGGHVVTDIVLDARQDVPKAEATIEARNLELKRIFPQLASPRGSAGRFGGRAKFRTQGQSVGELFGSANGEAAIGMTGGEASTLTLVLTNLDLARAATLLIGGDKTAEIHCGIASLHAKNGVLTPELFVVDTSAELITGTGSINFREGKYDLHLKADSKDPSLLALKGPIVIGGTFAKPVIRPEVGPVVARVGAAIGLGVLAPPLALLPLIDPGDAPSANCGALFREARVQTGTTQPLAAEQKEKAKRNSSTARNQTRKPSRTPLANGPSQPSSTN